jgi:sugar diacid utilization regulator
MKDSLQELLLNVPLFQLKFLTPLPKQLLYFNSITQQIPNQLLENPTIVTITAGEELERLNSRSVANQLIQDPNLISIVVFAEDKALLKQEVLTLYEECKLPLIQIMDLASLNVFQYKGQNAYFYSKLSKELAGAMESGVTKLASELSKGLGTPFLYLNENQQLLWQTGSEMELKVAHRWLNAHLREIQGMNEDSITISTNEDEGFKVYSVNIAGVLKHSLLVLNSLVDWQKKMIDKFIGLTALILQTEGMFREQQQIMQEHFVYDLLYHKFQSQKVMITQAKTWGWNLEIPHHLLIIHVDVSDDLMSNMDWLDEMVFLIVEKKADMEETIIVFPFQDQIVVLLEDGEDCTNSERNNRVLAVANQIEKVINEHFAYCQISIGIGKWYRDATFLNKSYQEAIQALRFGKIWLENRSVFHINDLGVLRLLIHIHQEILFDYCQEYLSVLLESDRDHGTDFINTLKVYIQHQGIISDVSEALFVHPNTLRNRIKKIEDKTGINLQDPEEFMNLMVALKIRSFINL